MTEKTRIWPTLLVIGRGEGEEILRQGALIANQVRVLTN
jgi:hypothetical protein